VKETGLSQEICTKLESYSQELLKIRKTLKPPASYPDKSSLGKMKKTKSLELEMLCFDINEDETEILFCC